MRHTSTCLFAVAFFALALPCNTRAETTPIQLLPPVQYPIVYNDAGFPEPCNALTGNNRFLTWDGSSAMRCVEGLMVSDTGNVGIGTTSPIAPLTVGLGARGINMGMNPWGGTDQFDIANTSGGAYLYAYSTGSESASIGAYSSGGRPFLINPVGGNVGVNTTSPQSTLDVNGEIRAGNTNAACTWSNAGAMRYNSSTGTFQGCNGSTWKSLGGGTVSMVNCNWATSVGGTNGGGYRPYDANGTVYHYAQCPANYVQTGLRYFHGKTEGDFGLEPYCCQLQIQ